MQQWHGAITKHQQKLKNDTNVLQKCPFQSGVLCTISSSKLPEQDIYCFPQRSAALALPWQRVYQAVKHGASFSPIPGLSFIGHVRQNPLRDRIDRHVPTQSCARRTCYTLESKRTDVQQASSGLLQIRCVSTWHRVSYCHGRTGFFSTPGVRHLPVGFFQVEEAAQQGPLQPALFSLLGDHSVQRSCLWSDDPAWRGAYMGQEH